MVGHRRSRKSSVANSLVTFALVNGLLLVHYTRPGTHYIEVDLVSICRSQQLVKERRPKIRSQLDEILESLSALGSIIEQIAGRPNISYHLAPAALGKAAYILRSF